MVASMIEHIYPTVLQGVSGRGYAGCLDGYFQGCRGEAMQDLGYELRRILIPRTGVKIVSAVALFHSFGVARQGPWVTWVNKGKKKGRNLQSSTFVWKGLRLLLVPLR